MLLNHFVLVGPGCPERVGCAAQGAGGPWDEGADFLGHAFADQGYFFLLDVGWWMHCGILLPRVPIGVEAQSVAGKCE